LSKIKRKQLEKIKKIRIWPALLGIFASIAILYFLMYILVTLYLSSMVSMRIEKARRTVIDTADTLGLRSPNRTLDTMSVLFRYRYINGAIPELDGLCFIDKDGKVTDSLGRKIFSYEDCIKFRNSRNRDSGEELYADPDNYSIIIRADGVAILDASDMLDSLFVIPGLGRSVDDVLDHKVTSLGLWYLLDDPATGGKTAFYYDIIFTVSDYMLLSSAVVGVIALLIVFMIHRTISVFRLFHAKRRLYDIVYSDIVTGGHNALFFFRKCVKLYKRARRGKLRYAIVNIRLEKYRSIIACFGKEAADSLIKYIYATLQKNAFKNEEYAHIENGDFAMMLLYTDQTTLNARLRNLMEKLEEIGNGSRLYYNIGVCPVDDLNVSPEDYYNKAYIVRALIKDENADAINWYSEKVREQQFWERKVENDMQRALEQKEFEMYLQPKYTTSGETVGGAEALVRWIHPTEGFVPPGRFIPIFEKNGFILKLDDYMINEVARYQAKWISEGRKVVPISVNVSRAHFLNDNLAEHIRDIIDSYCVPHDCIELELTESAFFDDKNALISTVKKMQSYGFMVSMDDFGAGYSSLNSLKELPLDVIKLDAEFFRGEDADERGKLIVTETIELAKQLGMHIVAEGIETREQVDFLKERECDLIQGYYFAKPMPATEFEKCAWGNDAEQA